MLGEVNWSKIYCLLSGDGILAYDEYSSPMNSLRFCAEEIPVVMLQSWNRDWEVFAAKRLMGKMPLKKRSS